MMDIAHDGVEESEKNKPGSIILSQQQQQQQLLNYFE